MGKKEIKKAGLARALADQCDICGHGSGEWTREASFGRNGVTSVLKVIKRKELDQKVISAVELESGGPTAVEPA